MFANCCLGLPWVDVSPQLTTWMDTANSAGSAIASSKILPDEMPVTLAELHSSFERIHPFIDGNGRTGRLVLNLILVRLGFPPAIIFKANRNRNLNALDKADKGDAGPLAELLARSVIDNLHPLIVPSIAGPAKVVPLKSLASQQHGDLSDHPVGHWLATGVVPWRALVRAA